MMPASQPAARPRRAPAIGALALLLSLALVAVALRAALGPGEDHLAGAECRGCHLAEGGVNPQKAALLVGPEEALCGRCHRAATTVSHPSGIPVARALPADYPLDWKGDLTCSSCHRAHGRAPGLLRGARRGRELCHACHDAAFFRRMRDGGASMMASGHGAAAPAGPAADIDPYSARCLECHGEQGDSNAQPVGVDRHAVARHSGRGGNHPIGRSYAAAMRYGGYRQESEVRRRLLLPMGMVSCVSCHQGYSKDHGKVVAVGRGSSLCFECHDL